jgi:hypothetical protein
VGIIFFSNFFVTFARIKCNKNSSFFNGFGCDREKRVKRREEINRAEADFW